VCVCVFACVCVCVIYTYVRSPCRHANRFKGSLLLAFVFVVERKFNLQAALARTTCSLHRNQCILEDLFVKNFAFGTLPCKLERQPARCCGGGGGRLRSLVCGIGSGSQYSRNLSLLAIA
jgi:hypothetical protein